MGVRVKIEGEVLGTVIRERVSEIGKYIESVTRMTVDENMTTIENIPKQTLDEMIYSANPKHYKWTHNLAKALTIDVDTAPRDATVGIRIYNDSNKVRDLVKRPKQQPIEEIPMTINTGVGYPSGWRGPTKARPYIFSSADKVADLLEKELRQKFS